MSTPSTAAAAGGSTTATDQTTGRTSTILPNLLKFKQALKKTNTSRVYKQTKFNLLREEAEGYSKVICLLTTLASSSSSSRSSSSGGGGEAADANTNNKEEVVEEEPSSGSSIETTLYRL